MKLLSEREVIKTAIKNWLGYYGLTRSYGADKRGIKVGEGLSKLDPETCTREQVNQLIGNDYWTPIPMCVECGKKSWNLVELGQESNDGSETVQLCSDCLKSALTLVEQQHGKA